MAILEVRNIKKSFGKVKVLKGEEGVGPFRSLTGKVMAELQAGSYEFEVKY